GRDHQGLRRVEPVPPADTAGRADLRRGRRAGRRRDRLARYLWPARPAGGRAAEAPHGDCRGGEGPGGGEEAPRQRRRADRAGDQGIHGLPRRGGEALGGVLHRDRPAQAVTTAMAPATPIVSLRGVGKLFGSGTRALDGLDLDVYEGEFLSLLG